MGFLRRTADLAAAVDALPLELPETGPTFGVEIDPAMLGITTGSAGITMPARVTRREAMSVPAIKRGRDLIAGSLGTLPLKLLKPDNTPEAWSLFDQPERDVPRSVTLTRTIEDLLFEGVAWWKVTAVGWHGKPVEVVRLDPRTVTVQQDMRVYVTAQGNTGQNLEWVPDQHLIRFDSPNDPLLSAGARAIRACLALDNAALRYADGAPPVDYFTPAEGTDPTAEDVVEALDAWAVARRSRATGFVPTALKYEIGGWDPQKLQLADARQHAVLELARCMGIDPEDLGVSTTSRTYANQFDRRKAFMDFTLGGFRQAFEDRLSMNDVSPRGYTARLDLSEFLRSDDKTRMEVYKTGLEVGAFTPPEVRIAERKPLISPAEPPAAGALPSTEEPANA